MDFAILKAPKILNLKSWWYQPFAFFEKKLEVYRGDGAVCGRGLTGRQQRIRFSQRCGRAPDESLGSICATAATGMPSTGLALGSRGSGTAVQAGHKRRNECDGRTDLRFHYGRYRERVRSRRRTVPRGQCELQRTGRGILKLSSIVSGPADFHRCPTNRRIHIGRALFWISLALNTA
jgi:hypothetical protein